MTRDELVERALAGANHLRWLISKHQHETIVPEIREACAEWSKQAAAIEALAALPPEPVGLPVIATCGECGWCGDNATDEWPADEWWCDHPSVETDASVDTNAAPPPGCPLRGGHRG